MRLAELGGRKHRAAEVDTRGRRLQGDGDCRASWCRPRGSPSPPPCMWPVRAQTRTSPSPRQRLQLSVATCWAGSPSRPRPSAGGNGRAGDRPCSSLQTSRRHLAGTSQDAKLRRRATGVLQKMSGRPRCPWGLQVPPRRQRLPRPTAGALGSPRVSGQTVDSETNEQH